MKAGVKKIRRICFWTTEEDEQRVQELCRVYGVKEAGTAVRKHLHRGRL